MKKQCTQCAIIKDLDDFYRKPTASDGRSSYCKVCYRKYSITRHYRKHKERLAQARDYYRRHKAERIKHTATANARYPEKNSARNKLRSAVYSGKIAKLPCETCGNPNSQGHHHKGYDKPLEVQWLCSIHHGQAHSRTDKTKLTDHYVRQSK